MARVRTVLVVTALLVTVGAAPAAAAPPSADPPTGLRTTSVTATSVGLAWSVASGATSYQVLRGTPTTTPAVVATTSLTTYADAGRTPGTAYTYAVTAVRKKGVSSPSEPLTVTTVPAAPQSLTATATGTSTASLSWTAATGATSYQVWRSTGTASPALRTTVAADAQSFTDTGLAAGTTYRWTVRATNTSGTSGDSPTATATTAALPKTAATVSIRSSGNPSVAGDAVTFTVQVSGPNGTAVPTGSVTLYALGSQTSAALNPNGVASFGRTFGTAGSWTVSASYGGDGRYTGASSSLVQVVQSPPPPPTLFGPYAAFATGSWPASVVTADVDGDGQAEAVLSTQSYASSPNDYQLLVHHFTPGTPTPTVTKVPTGDGYGDSAQLGTGDLNGDGTDDVVLAADGSVKTFLGSPQGLQAPVVTPVDGEVWDVVVAELTGDDHLDVVAAVAAVGGGVVRLLPGRGDGTFGPADDISIVHASESPPAVAVGDIRQDGYTDVVALWRSSRTVEVLVDFGLPAGGNWDTWRIDTLTGSEWPEAVAAGDVTGDGYVDLVVTAGGNRPSSQLVVVAGTATGLGTQSVLASYDAPEPVVVADLTGDGRSDVVTAHGGWYEVGVYLQQPAGGLGPEAMYDVPYASHYEHRGLAVGDVTGDLRPDVVLADYNNGLVVLPGTCPAYCGA